ncbi:hypothetical protein ACFVW5_37870 [Streptomyces sp. NPDC058232]|uniref:hypothetical protein n=1 Tax=Streptomyces sp. NPDC058232 TaxID=3346393 RepID=UPI0036E428DA
MDANTGQNPRMPQPSGRALTYAEEITPEDIRALEAFLYVQWDRVYEEVGQTGETAFAMRSLLRLISDSAGFLHTLITVERPDAWQRAAIVREWQRLRSTAHEFNHCDGYDHGRWWHQVQHFDARDEASEQDRIHEAR